jgi:hypothetical protein
MRLVPLLVLAACASTSPKFSGTVRVTDHRLVAINPDVKTVVDADRPVFFAHGAFYLFDDGMWWRSSEPTGPWTFDKKPPVPVRQIEQPFAYVHYKKDQTGKEVETVARGFNERETATEPKPSAKDGPATAVDPSVDPTVN